MKQKKIAIICYSYSDGFAYMEQKIAKAFVELGMEVLVICSTANRVDSNTVVHVRVGEYPSNGYSVCRLPFITGGHLPDHKMPIILKGMYAKLSEFKPDIIYHMSCSAINLLSVYRYMKNCRETELFVDNHASFENSANNFVSRVILHRLIYKNITHIVDKYIKKYFYVGYGEKIFLQDFYKIDKDKCYFFSLGDFVLDNEHYDLFRKEIRTKDNIHDGEIVITYSGKFTRRKKTIEIIRIVSSILRQYDNIHFYLVGSVQEEEIADEFNEAVNNGLSNFRYVGWKSSDELRKILCGTDIYIQFEPSSTFQTALCCRAYGITGNGSKAYDVYPDGVFEKVDSIEEMQSCLMGVINSGRVRAMKGFAFDYAKAHLDYKNQIQELIFENSPKLGEVYE